MNCPCGHTGHVGPCQATVTIGALGEGGKLEECGCTRYCGRKKLCDLAFIYQEAIAAHEVYRRLGFSAEYVFLEVARSGEIGSEHFLKTCIYTKLVVPGAPEFRINLGPTPGKAENVTAEWEEAIAVFGTATDPEAFDLLEHSQIYKAIALIIAKIRQKGIPIPKELS